MMMHRQAEVTRPGHQAPGGTQRSSGQTRPTAPSKNQGAQDLRRGEGGLAKLKRPWPRSRTGVEAGDDSGSGGRSGDAKERRYGGYPQVGAGGHGGIRHEGDWECGGCGYPNFARRSACINLEESEASRKEKKARQNERV